MTSFTSYFKTFSILIISTAFVYCNLSFNEIAINANTTQSLTLLNGEKIISTNGLDKNTTLSSDSMTINLVDSKKVIKKADLMNNKASSTLEKKPKKPLILKKIVVL